MWIIPYLPMGKHLLFLTLFSREMDFGILISLMKKLLVEFHTLTNGLRQSLMEWGRILKDLEVSPITIFRENLHSISNL